MGKHDFSADKPKPKRNIAPIDAISFIDYRPLETIVK